MKKLTEWLDIAKDKSGSDYATAKEIGVTRQCIAQARNRSSISDENCAKLANYINVNPIQIIAGKDIEKKPQNEKLWGKWIAAASVILALGITTQQIDFNKNINVSSIQHSIHYAQLYFGVVGRLDRARLLMPVCASPPRWTKCHCRSVALDGWIFNAVQWHDQVL